MRLIRPNNSKLDKFYLELFAYMSLLRFLLLV